MQQERISDNVYWFQSERYAQVSAGVIVGPQWAIVVDTLPVPEETIIMRDFITEKLNVPVRYLINTHSHSDHAWGNCFFPGATIIAHTLCAEYLATRGVAALEESKLKDPTFQDIHIVLPQLTFSDGEVILKVGKKNVIVLPAPGHTSDGVAVYVEDDKILFAGDSFMPIPSLAEGNYLETLNIYEKYGSMELENIIQGHGEIILRGEIYKAIESNVNYMRELLKKGIEARKKRNPAAFLSNISIEDCGKERVYLGGIAEDLHRSNLFWIYNQIIAEYGKPAEDEYDDDSDDDDFSSYSDDFSTSSAYDEDCPDDYDGRIDDDDDFYSNCADDDDDDDEF